MSRVQLWAGASLNAGESEGCCHRARPICLLTLLILFSVYATGFCLLTVCVCVYICVCVISGGASFSPYGCDLCWYCQITNYKLYYFPRKSMWQFLCSPPQPFSWKVIFGTHWKSSWNYNAVPACGPCFLWVVSVFPFSAWEQGSIEIFTRIS